MRHFSFGGLRSRVSGCRARLAAALAHSAREASAPPSAAVAQDIGEQGSIETSAPRAMIALPAQDSKAVVEAYRRLYFPQDEARLRPIVADLRRDADALPAAVSADERLCVTTMRYVNASMALGAPEALVCASDYLDGAVSSCGGYAMVMAELLRVAGLPARYLGLFGIPSTGSHALCEVYVDGGGRLFGPAGGVFFYSRPQWDGAGEILSTEAVMTARARPAMMQVVETPWRLNYEQEKNFPVQPLLDPPTSHVMTYWSENGRRGMFPVAFGNDAVISAPVDIDLRETHVHQLGERTGAWLDTWLKCIDDPRNGYFQIGGDCPKIHHCVRIKSAFPGRVRALYVATPESEGALQVFPLAHCLLLDMRVEGLETRLEFFVNGPEPSFLLTTPGAVWIDTLTYTFEPDA